MFVRNLAAVALTALFPTLAQAEQRPEQTFGEWEITQYDHSCVLSRDVNYDEGVFSLMLDYEGDVSVWVQAWEEPRDARLELNGRISIDGEKGLRGKVRLRVGDDYNSYDFGWYEGTVLDWFAEGTRASAHAGTSVWLVSLDGSAQAIRLLRDCATKLPEPTS